MFNHTNCYYSSIFSDSMGLFDTGSDENVQIENADLDCEPQNEFVSEQEVAPLDGQLNPGERVHYLFTGEDGRRTAITDERVLIYHSYLIGTESQTVRYGTISAVRVSNDLAGVQIRIDSTTSEYRFRIEQASDTENIAHEAAEFIRDRTSKQSSSDDTQNDSESALDKLEILKDLKEEGIISEEELEEKKDDLMDDI